MSLFEEIIEEVEKEEIVNEYDAAIIGSGPAGCTAAIYLTRAGFNVVMFGSPFKTSLSIAGEIENYPGIKKIDGLSLAQLMIEQAKESGARHVEKDVKGVTREEDGTYIVITSDDERYRVYAVILATGALRKKAAIKGEKEYTGKGVSYCAVCDGPLYKGKPVAVLGYDRNAGKDAVYLAGICSDVYIISDKEFEFDREHMELLKDSKHVQFIKEKIREIQGDGNKVTGVVLESGRKIDVSAVFIVLGETPNTYLASSLGIETTPAGILVNRPSQETNVPGVFAAGDVTNNIKQVAVAVGEGCDAAMHAMRYIRRKKRELKK